jgi:cystathionine beta-lyase
MSQSLERNSLKLESQLVHPPGDNDPRFGDVVVPLHLTTTYSQETPGNPIRYDYSRGGNPTRQVVEDQIAALEGGVSGYAFGSGMAAIAAVISLLEPGSEVLIPTNVYGGTFRILERYFKQYGITNQLVDISDINAVDAAFAASPKRNALLFETPTNPLLSIADIAALSEVAHKYGALVIVDNTFLTPYLQQPLRLGADIVVHSATKYLAGHSDVVAGLVVVNSQELGERIHFIQYSTGGILSPFDSYLLLRGIKTLALRLDRQSESAQTLAEWLQKQPQVTQVYYPGLPEHPGYGVHKKQSKTGGGLISFDLAEGYDPTKLFGNLKLVTLAESLGAVESLVCHPASMTHASIPADTRKEMGITDQLVRLSVGIEHISDLEADIQQAFATL